MKNLKVVCVSVCLIFMSGHFLMAQGVNIKKLKKHIAYLASDELNGRGTSSAGEALSAKYISDEFKKMNLTPKGNNGFFHEFTFKKNNDVHGLDTVSGDKRNSKNVVGFLYNGAEKNHCYRCTL